MARFFEWTPHDEPATIRRPTSPADWETIERRYSPTLGCASLKRVTALAQELAAVAVVIEHRYIDADYRSEHAAFYTTTFRRYPSVCDRVHFFSCDVPDDLSGLGQLQDRYLGYSVMRPLAHSPVGRTMLRPPPELQHDATVCATEERVHLFGAELIAYGMPFISQDRQYLRCAHSAQWMVLRHSALRYGTHTWLPADIQAAATGGVVVGRQVPSDGLSVQQMLSSLTSLGLAPVNLLLPQTRADSEAADYLSLPAILCRHVNSQLPPIVVSASHAWVIVGYRVDANVSGPTHDRIIFYRHDDEMGPYIRVPDPWNEPHQAHRPWQIAIPPLQRKCYVTSERAELLGKYWLRQLVAIRVANAHPGSVWSTLDLTFRTYVQPSWEFKSSTARISPPSVGEVYRLAHLPRFVWIVEAVDRSGGHPGHVVGEVIVDSTANHVSSVDDVDPILAVHVGGRAFTVSPDHEIPRVTDDEAAFAPYESGCPAAVI